MELVERYRGEDDEEEEDETDDDNEEDDGLKLFGVKLEWDRSLDWFALPASSDSDSYTFA